MKRLFIAILWPILTLIVSLSGLTLASRWATEPHLQTLRNAFDLNKCGDQPCWHGIQFGKTTPEEATTILINDPSITLVNSEKEKLGCYLSWSSSIEISTWRGFICDHADKPIMTFALTNLSADSTFRLLDAILLYGKPYNVDCELDRAGPSEGTLYLGLDFPNGLTMTAKRELPFHGLILDPELVISRIQFNPLAETPLNGNIPWPGFSSERLDPSGVAPIYPYSICYIPQ